MRISYVGIVLFTLSCLFATQSFALDRKPLNEQQLRN